eukprot:TRINITY_DN29452_c0_g1_i2.p3 TRINITY_DN29452_c0_g1~~TRINITY_DN29452_c0_g1_i2.p3  ORF type:complete len:129 (+),score=55.09 TRINITY_DN29452_c0_g1_i2:67-453(+)
MSAEEAAAAGARLEAAAARARPEVNLAQEFELQVRDVGSRVSAASVTHSAPDRVEAQITCCGGELLSVVLTEAAAFEVTWTPDGAAGPRTERFDSLNTALHTVSGAARAAFAGELSGKLAALAAGPHG